MRKLIAMAVALTCILVLVGGSPPALAQDGADDEPTFCELLHKTAPMTSRPSASCCTRRRARHAQTPAKQRRRLAPMTWRR